MQSLLNISKHKICVNEEDFEKLLENDRDLRKWVRIYEKKRYLYKELKKISEQYFVGIKGMRGIGKTVLLLQIALETKDSIYFSADHKILKKYSIYEIVDDLKNRGFNNIFIDEIHTRSKWDEDIKTIYDEHKVRVFFTGSSAIELKNTSMDLSRRVVLLHLKPASFREFLNLKHKLNLAPVSFGGIIKDKKKLTLKYADVSKYFIEYMKFGGVLYSGKGFRKALENSIEKIITKDLISLRNINVTYENDVYRVLNHIANSSPFELNYSSLSQSLGLTKPFVIRMISDLQVVGVLKVVFPYKRKGREVKKEPKVYLSIPLRFFYNQKPDLGAVREEFFVNHIEVQGYIKTKRGEKTPDFMVFDKIIEIGGASKKNYQDAKFIASDGLDYRRNKIPLFLFGFVY